MQDLPAELTSFVGRREELAAIKRGLSGSRLLTLTGPGGVGKTRLAARAAAELRRAFPDGVRLVQLADLEDGALLAQAVAAALGLRDQSARWLVATLADHLADRRPLLVLDNCEHLLDACAVLADGLLRECPQLRVLATSRQPLGIGGEVVLPVGPLAVPGERALPAEALLAYGAVRLFVDRATAVRPGFALEEDPAAVVELCRRLDGIPLAIELAAVRLRSLAPRDLLERLDDWFRLLTGGSRTTLPRHRTLWAAIDWSHHLLPEAGRVLWRRLSIFAGGFDLRAAEAVTSGRGIAASDVVDLLGELVDRSVVLAEREEARVRYRMLETIRGYGRERLAEAGEEAAVRRRHRDWYARLAGEERQLSARLTAWFDRLASEHDNLRVALDFCLRDPSEVEAGLVLAADLWLYWDARGHVGEGRRWLERLLAEDNRATPARARALWVAAYLALVQADPAAAVAMLHDSRRLAEQLGDDRSLAFALQFLGRVMLFQGDLDAAVRLCRRALALHRAGGERTGAALTLVQLGIVHCCRVEPELVAACCEQSLALSEGVGDDWNGSYALWGLGLAAWLQGDHDRAREAERDALRRKRTVDDRVGAPLCIEALAWIAMSEGDAERAARLLGAAESARLSIPAPLPSPFAAWHDACEAAARQALGGPAFSTAERHGAGLGFERAVAEALGEATVPAREPFRGAPPAVALTAREAEVAGLVAEGLSDREIAARLVVSPRTAETHVQHILRKLGFRSRAQIAGWVAGAAPNRPDVGQAP